MLAHRAPGKHLHTAIARQNSPLRSRAMHVHGRVKVNVYVYVHVYVCMYMCK